MLDVAIVTNDLQGPIRNGGIGTAYTNLAKWLVLEGHKVTVLYLRGTYCENGSIEDWIGHYRCAGITLIPLPNGTRPVQGIMSSTLSFRAYRWLKEHHFDLVHFPDWGGSGYYTVLAKHQGLAFANTEICVGMHSPTLWHLRYDQRPVRSQEDIARDFMERKSVELADSVISPSEYLLEWARENEWILPKNTCVIPNLYFDEEPKREAVPGPVEEIAFFGRLEQRKGLTLFCNVVEELMPVLEERGIQISFIGKNSQVDGRESQTYLAWRTARWTIKNHRDMSLMSDGALRYLRRRRTLAVLPSLGENSPYALVECARAGIPYIASSVGGIPELLTKEAQERHLFKPNFKSLAAKIQDTLDKDIRDFMAPSLAHTEEALNSRWRDWHREAEARVRFRASAAPTEKRKLPFITICLVHYNRPQTIRHTLDSIRRQDYKDFEVILVDDGSDQPSAIAYLDSLEPEFAERGWRIIRQENKFVGAARNHAARLAKGEYLMIMDDDNEAEPFELSVFAEVARNTNADVLSCCFYLSYETKGMSGDPVRKGPDDPIWLPVGGAAALGLHANYFGDTNSFLKRETFLALGGYSEEYGIGLEDWEFFARASLAGYDVQMVPEALFWYRQHGEGISITTPSFENRYRTLRPYMEAVPVALRPLILMAYGTESAFVEAGGSYCNGLEKSGPQLEARFQSPDARTLLRLDSDSGFSPVTMDGTLPPIDRETVLRFEANTRDPKIFLPNLGFPDGDEILVQIDLTTPYATWVELFYLGMEDSFYTEGRRLRCHVLGGRNLIHFRLPPTFVQGAIRIDPGDLLGFYTIYSIEVRSLFAPGKSIMEVEPYSTASRLGARELKDEPRKHSEVRADFASPSARTLLYLSESTGFDAVDLRNSTGAVETFPALTFEAANPDPMLMLPCVSFIDGEVAFLRVELSTPVGTWIDLFYQIQGDTQFTAERKLRQWVIGGRTTVQFRLPLVSLRSALRLDPGVCTGRFTIYSIEVRSVPTAIDNLCPVDQHLDCQQNEFITRNDGDSGLGTDLFS